DRRAFLEHVTVGCVVLAAPRRLPGLAPGVSGPTGQLAAPFELEEVTIAALQAGLESGKYTARSLVTAYLQRIDELDRKGPTLRAVLEANPDALTQAAALDAERKAKGPRGPLHGIPVLVKDNVATRDRMQSTAGSLALAGVSPPRARATRPCSAFDPASRRCPSRGPGCRVAARAGPWPYARHRARRPARARRGSLRAPRARSVPCGPAHRSAGDRRSRASARCTCPTRGPPAARQWWPLRARTARRAARWAH